MTEYGGGTKHLYGKVFADMGIQSMNSLSRSFDRGIVLCMV